MKNIVIMPNGKKDAGFLVTCRVVNILKRNNASVFVDLSLEKHKELQGVEFVDLNSLSFAIDAIIVVGGDGSILDASVYSIKHDAPILGINLGRVGYLSEIDVCDLDKLDKLADNMINSSTYGGGIIKNMVADYRQLRKQHEEFVLAQRDANGFPLPNQN